MAHQRSLRIAPSHYHVGHVVPAMVAKEMNFFEEEGLEDYEIVTGGLIPAIAEKIGLRRAMKEKSIDIVPDAKPLAAFTLKDRGEDIYIIGCWRNRQNACFVGGKDVKTLADLKGRKIGARDLGGISYTLLSTQLRKTGLDPEKDVTWVTGARFHGQENSIETLRRGEIDCVSGGGDADVEDLKAEGFHILFESSAFGGVQRPSRVTVGTRQVIEERRKELEAYFRAIIRAYWFIADRERNTRFLNPLVKRLRRCCLDVEESQRKSLEAGGHDVLPFDGAPSVEGLNQILKETQETGQIGSSFKLEDILRLDPVCAAFGQLQRREDLKDEFLRAQQVFTLRDAGARRPVLGTP